MKSEVLEKHVAELEFTKATRREMGDELTGAHEQISSQPASTAKKISAEQKALGALCNESGGNRSINSSRTVFQYHLAGYDELMKAFGGQRTLLDKKRRGSSKTPETNNHQNTQYNGLLTVCAPVEEILVIYNTSSCPTTLACDDSSATVSTTNSNQAHTLRTAALSATSTDHVQR